MSESRPNTHLSERDLARLRRRLENLRASLSATEPIRLLEPEAIDPGDAIDLGARALEQEAALRREALDRKLLEEVEHTLAKLDAGTYGFSEDSGQPIEIERLEAVPWARRTADEEERRQALEPTARPERERAVITRGASR